MKKLFLLIIIAGTLAALTGCRTYCGYRTEEKWVYGTVPVDTEKEVTYHIENTGSNIVLYEYNETINEYRNDKYTITYRAYTSDHLGIYIGHALVSPICFFVCTLGSIDYLKTKNTYYNGNTYKYTALRQWWNYFWLFCDPFDPERHIEGEEASSSLTDEVYYKKSTVRKSIIENYLLEVELADGEAFEVENNITINELRRRIFAHAYPGKTADITISAKKKTLRVTLDSLDMMKKEDLAWINSLPELKEKECFLQYNALLTRLDKLKSDKLIAVEVHTNHAASIKQRASNYRKLLNSRNRDMEQERTNDRSLD